MSACIAISYRLPHLPHLPRIPHCRPIEVKKTLAASIPHEARSKNSTRRGLLFLSLPMSALLFLHSNSAADPSSGFDPVTDAEKDASSALSRRIGEAVRLLDLAREFQAKGEFSRALDYFTQIINDYKDFAFTEYARVGRALLLYEIGDRQQAITEMEDVSISLKGYPEIHAALAAALYTDRHAPLLAENQFTIATILDPCYADLSYVREKKHWPPSLVRSLKNFITLS
ncbi:uncharacterized protein LOC110038482 [Phalaenopsis equestris]|uniref:Tetratricopeptide repeat protein n=1 Tax=Phalaenopsis equestris TaxID=78828 RepID=A0A1S6YG34_PHAEQ|nr:uncharacterized protein LOC110038482 [Phalaenopsis equestris]AQX44228.1 hypothetical protein [Phalaenopsis equestris]